MSMKTRSQRLNKNLPRTAAATAAATAAWVRKTAVTAARVSKSTAAKSNPSIQNPSIWWVVHFEDDVNMEVNAKVDAEADVNKKADLPTIERIQELQTIVAQYEQEKLRLKKKDKKIE